MAEKATTTAQELPKVGARVQYTGTDGVTLPADVMEQTGGTGLTLSVNHGTENTIKQGVLHQDDKKREAEHSYWAAL